MMFPAPAPGFDDPLGMLRACHERILRHGRWLQAVVHGDDAAVLTAVHRYFATAGQEHHEDEEQDLFPLLIARDGAPLVNELLVQHRTLDGLWQRLAPGFGEPRLLQGPLAKPAIEFVSLNESHIELENRELLPLAAKLLTPKELAVLGQHMAQRRGVEL